MTQQGNFLETQLAGIAENIQMSRVRVQGHVEKAKTFVNTDKRPYNINIIYIYILKISNVALSHIIYLLKHKDNTNENCT